MFSNYSDGLSSLAYQISEALRIKAYCFQISTNDTHDAMNAFSYIENGEKVRTVYARPQMEISLPRGNPTI